MTYKTETLIDWLSLMIAEQNHFACTYSRYKDDTIRYITSSWSVTIDDAIDIYQSTMCILYEKHLVGSLYPSECPVFCLIKGIAKNLCRQHSRRQKTLPLSESEGVTRVDSPEESSKCVKVMAHLASLPTKSRKLLELFYFQNWSLKQISEELGYKNVDTAKNLKYKSLNRLRSRVLAS